MADKRENNGGKRENAGRKPKADEIKLIEQMDAVLVPEQAWKALSNRVKDGDVNAIKTWLGYRYGMPKQIIESTNNNINQTPIFGDNPLDDKDSSDV